MSTVVPTPDIAAVAQPGDKLVVGFRNTLTPQTAEVIRERLRELLPELAQIVVIDGVAGLAVLRPGEAFKIDEEEVHD